MRRPRIQRALVDISTQAHRIISVLSELYGMSYSVVKTFYYRFNENVSVVKYHLRLMVIAGNECEIIN